jgi:hypothetical protein
MQIVTWNVLDHTAIKYLTLDTPVECQRSDCRNPERDRNEIREKNYRDRYRDIATYLQAEVAQDNVEIICLQEVHYNLYKILENSGGLLGLGGLAREYQMFRNESAGLLTLIRKKNFEKDMIMDMSREICPIDMPLDIQVQAYFLKNKDQLGGFYVVNTHLPGKPGPDGDYKRKTMVNRIVNSLKLCHEKKRVGMGFSMLMVGDMNQPGAVEYFNNNVWMIMEGKLQIAKMDPEIATSFHRFELNGTLGDRDEQWRQKNYDDRYQQIDYLIHSPDWMLDRKGEVTPAGGMYGYETPYKVDSDVDLALFMTGQAKNKPKFVDNFDVSRGGWLSDHALIKFTLRKRLDSNKLRNSAEALEFRPRMF